ncbi:MAG: hypothetical protein BGO96_07745 [Micrococcales bacterium 73-15]|nr:MAG: hypothetical protein BGO96_07745 [Micrococcales bacterium 73-15]
MRVIAATGSGALVAASALAAAVPAAAEPSAPDAVEAPEVSASAETTDPENPATPESSTPTLPTPADLPADGAGDGSSDESTGTPTDAPADEPTTEDDDVPGIGLFSVSTSAPVVINEVYGGGGNANAVLTHDFIELRNVSTSDVDLSGWSVQYASAAGTNWSGIIPLTGVLEAGGYYLVQGASGGAVGAALPTPDASGTVNLSGTNGNVALATGTTALSCATTACASDARVVDLVGFGTGAAYAGTGAAPAPSNTTSITRDADSTNTANNAADFTVANPPTPQGGDVVVPPEPEPQDAPIADIRAAGFTARTVTTRGVVTAHYPTGGFNGYVIQTPGTGGDDTEDRTVSDAIFVFSSATVGDVELGDYVEVTGQVGEYNGLGQITVASGGVSILSDVVEAPKPLAMAWPATNPEREAIESMLLQPDGDYTISNTYSTNQYGEIGIASGTEPLLQPTDIAPPGTPEAAAVVADNAARAVAVDDGASTNFLSPANSALKPTYIAADNQLRVGAAITFVAPVIVDWRNNAWKLNPTTQVTAEEPGDYPVTWEQTRTPAPAAVGGDITVASFNVLNYFTTLGKDVAGCQAYPDRDGNPITVNTGCNARGAWDADNLARQQVKIVEAINALDASVVGLMEIENSAKLGETPDEATATLVDALNERAGTTRWAYVPSSADLPSTAQQDVITNAIIYQPAEVTPVGDARALGNLSGSGQPFVNAREPIGQTFVPVGGTAADEVFVVVNHFKSKGSAGPFPGDTDTGNGQGASNGSRVLQATALRDWVADQTDDGDAVVLLGDFNSYGQEDPLQVLYTAGYADVEQHFDLDESSYSFQGLSGSLDHVLLNDVALSRATGADIWQINSGEPLALEYSRYNYHGAIYYEPNAYRSSDHDPVIVGLEAADDNPNVDLSFLNINDFHGRIGPVGDGATVQFAGTVEEQRKDIEDAGGEALFLSAGDNIGASLFTSSVAQDQPTIDVLNALGLASSAVGNHEFDQGIDDLIDRVIDGGDNARWSYLGANVYDADGNTVLPEYSLHTVNGLTVAVIGAITEETPALVTPAGIEGLTFGDPVEAVNRVVGELATSHPEVDVIVAEYHEGAGAGTPDGATLEQEVDAGGAFADIVTGTDAAVDVIFTGHTHKQYAWDAPVPGVAGKTRPILQTGSYGEYLGRVDLTYDTSSGEVVDYTATNVKRTTTAEAALVSAFPRVAEVKGIVDAAIAHAAEIGNQPIGEVSADITTAFAGGSYVDGTYVGSGPLPATGRDDRAKESTLGGLVADSLVATLSDERLGGATIGVVNPGGLRAELFRGEDGVITYAEANAVLPFVNNLWTTTLTGDQFKTMLEQQWQRDAAGNVPSRPYLQLGLSSNVSYTYDDSRAEGDRITSITIDGAPYDPAASYRIGTFSFLATGGDNFRIFTQGTDTKDSGLVDRDAWIDYLKAHKPVSPSFARRATQVPALEDAAAGDRVAFTVGGLDLTSLGSPQNTEVTVTLGFDVLGTFPVANGSASVDVEIPATAAGGDRQLVVTAAPSGTEIRVPIAIESEYVNASFLNINDFHGRIGPVNDGATVQFAGTVEQQRAAIRADAGEDLFLSAGDNIGASLFTSSVAQDQPTIDVLNALGLASSAVGNHEFDQGIDDLIDRVIDGGNNAQWPYLGANVYDADGNTVLPEYSLHTVNGLTVAVIGAITEETPALVSPGGIEGLTFGDPVEAVNRVVGELATTHPEVDVIVAEYHEGAGAGTPDGATLAEEVAAGGAFADIVTKTDAAVDVIFTGHTHKQYAWDAPVPGVEGKTRPILQTGSYGEYLGRVDLVVSPTTGEVVAYEARNIPRTTTSEAALVSAFPRVAEVKQIVDAAIAYASEIGGQPIGKVSADITTAFSGGSYVDGRYVGPGPLPTSGRDNRAAASALGDLVADSLVATLSDADRGGATIGIVNPGGLRAELFHGEDGVITYAEANAVLPFVNNLWTTTLTGQQLVDALEEQWQVDGNGNVPSRPYLQLSLSENVSYTWDPDPDGDGVLFGDLDDQGKHITSVTVDGVALDLEAEYRVGSFSFLLEGGDNFRTLAEGTGTRDSGLIDRDAWIQYLRDNSADAPIDPDFARQGVTAPELGEVEEGSTLEFEVGSLNLTSLGAPENTSVTVSLGGAELGTFDVVDGKAAISVTIPKGTAPAPLAARALAGGGSTLTVVATESGTTANLPLTIVPAQDPNPTDTGSPTPTDTPTDGGSPTPSGTSTKPGGSMPGTGASVLPIVVVALAAVGVGAALAARRRSLQQR